MRFCRVAEFLKMGFTFISVVRCTFTGFTRLCFVLWLVQPVKKRLIAHIIAQLSIGLSAVGLRRGTTSTTASLRTSRTRKR